MGTPPTPFFWFESVVKEAKMAQIKLTYFNLRARAEPARLVLAYAGAKYDDVRLPAPWDNPKPWATLKPTTPYGQCPLLEWEGEVIAQSMAITRFLAAQFGLKGRNNVESAQVDEIVDAIEDVIGVTIKTHFEEDPKAKAAKVAELNKSHVLPTLLPSRRGSSPEEDSSWWGTTSASP